MYTRGGQKFNGKRVYRPEELAGGKNCILLCSPNENVYHEVGTQLNSLGIEWYHIDAGIWGLYKAEVKAVYDMLYDDYSKEIYRKLLQCHISCTWDVDNLVTRQQYFCLPEFFFRDPEEVFVDCGAYVGDTVERYIWEHDGVFKKIIALEPDFNSFSAMKNRLNRLRMEWNYDFRKIETYSCAVGDVDDIAYVVRGQNGGLGSWIAGKTVNCFDEIQIVKLDSFIDERIGFIKADIEGFEYKMLLGAKESIKKYRPKLAICIYHNAADFFQIPLLVKQINPDYRMAIRHHSSLWDETVLYAWE